VNASLLDWAGSQPAIRLKVPTLSSARLGAAVKISVLIIAALTIGVGSARWLMARSADTVPISGGDWKVWVEGGGRSPYEMAHFLSRGLLPPAARQMNVYETERDDAGALLYSSCSYSLSMPAQGVRWWEVAIVDPAGGRVLSGGGRMSAISSAQAVAMSDGLLTITVARDPAPGNWISAGSLSRFGLAVTLRRARLHDAIEPAEVLPRIARGECS